MNEQRKLRNLLAYTKFDSVEEIEECGKLYEEILAYINKQEKINKNVIEFMKLVEPKDNLTEYEAGLWIGLLVKIKKDLGEMK